MRKVIFTITKGGEVFLQAEGYEGQECMKSARVQRVLDLLKEQGQINRMELQSQKQTLTQEEKLW